MPRGGARVGSGRKKKTGYEVWLGGNASELPDVGHKKPEPVPVKLIASPEHMPEAQRAVWNDLAPFACQARTLVPQTAESFALLCKQIVMERMMFAQISDDGLTGNKVTLQMDQAGGGLQTVEKKAHTLLSQHRAMMQRIEAGMLRFKLSPMGKEMAVEEVKPADPFAEFEEKVQ